MAKTGVTEIFSKENDGRTETLAVSDDTAVHLEVNKLESLTDEHREYLQRRHGTLDLDPVPGYGDADPLNWPQWKKVCNLVLVAFHASMSTITAAAVLPAFQALSEEFHTSLQHVSYLASSVLLVLGVAPLFWRPLASRFGRRPIFLLSLILSMVCNLGSAYSFSYGAMAACRNLAALFISPALAIGSAVVAESFFEKERARFMGVWQLMITLGVPISPLVFGFLVKRIAFRWIFKILAMVNATQFVLYLIFGPETRYLRKGGTYEAASLKRQYLSVGRIDRTPFSFREFIDPLLLVRSATATIPTVAYSINYGFGYVLATIEIPQLFEPKFHLDSQALGLQYLSVIVGAILGEQIGGFISDFWMNSRARRIGTRPPPEFRLWLTYPGFVITIVGMVVFLVQIDNAALGHWNITPLVGIALAVGGNQIVTTICITYIVDRHPKKSAACGVFNNFVRHIWGFIGPFWYPPMFRHVGLKGSSGIIAALIFAVSIVPTIIIQFVIPRRRQRETA